EYITLSPDGRTLLYCANMGKEPEDIDRRHIFAVPVDRAAPVELTPGDGVEWTPVLVGDGKTVAFLGADAKRPPLPMVVPLTGGRPRPIAADRIPGDFPTAQLVVPRMVTFKAPDGTEVHGQL